jgi:hypothetical protein
MTLRISLASHAPIDLAAGLALMAAPFALGFEGPATFAALGLGVLLVGLGLSATSADGRGTLAPSAHAASDLALAIVLIVAGFAVGVSGDLPAFVAFAATGAGGLLLSGFTRYGAALA